MVKNTQTIRRLLPTNCLSLFDHFMGLALEGLRRHGVNPFHLTGVSLYLLKTPEKVFFLMFSRGIAKPSGIKFVNKRSIESTIFYPWAYGFPVNSTAWMLLNNTCDALRDLVPFVQFKKT